MTSSQPEGRSPGDMVAVELFGRELYPELVLACAALLTAVAGVLSAWAALRRTRQTDPQDGRGGMPRAHPCGVR